MNWIANQYPAVPNFTIADTAGTGSVEVYNSHGATINLVVDAFGYFMPSNAVTTAYTVTCTPLTPPAISGSSTAAP